METTTVVKKTRKGRKPANKTPYRVEGSALLVQWPFDYDPAKHKPLVPEDFESEMEYVFWDVKAEQYRQRMESALKEAALCRKFGSREQRQKASQLAKLQANIEALKRELGDLAIDV